MKQPKKFWCLHFCSGNSLSNDDIKNAPLKFSGLIFILLSPRYQVLHTLEFDSTRKRMSIILKTPADSYLMLCKGAESHVAPRCVTGKTKETLDHIDGYAEVRYTFYPLPLPKGILTYSKLVMVLDSFMYFKRIMIVSIDVDFSDSN